MSFSSQRFRVIGVGAAVAAALILTVIQGRCGDFRLESAGARYGFAANASSRLFQQAEGFADWDLPWGWDLGREWRLQMLLDSSAGWLGESGTSGLVLAAGPGLRLSRERFPLVITAGVNPTFLSNDEYPKKDFGTLYQFTSYLGVSLNLGAHFRFGYRFQHMSNGGLGPSNPGLNLNVLMLSYVF